MVGTHHLWRARWDGRDLALDADFRPRYRTIDGQTYGWDAVITGGAAWFLDNGEGTEGYAGSFARGQRVARAAAPRAGGPGHRPPSRSPRSAVRPNGIVANPPAIDAGRGIAVGYDSANGVLAAFDIVADGTTTPRWPRTQHHGCHPILYPDTGELVTDDHDGERMMDQIVVLDIETGEEQSPGRHRQPAAVRRCSSRPGSGATCTTWRSRS